MVRAARSVTVSSWETERPTGLISVLRGTASSPGAAPTLVSCRLTASARCPLCGPWECSRFSVAATLATGCGEGSVRGASASSGASGGSLRSRTVRERRAAFIRFALSCGAAGANSVAPLSSCQLSGRADKKAPTGPTHTDRHRCPGQSAASPKALPGLPLSPRSVFVFFVLLSLEVVAAGPVGVVTGHDGTDLRNGERERGER